MKTNYNWLVCQAHTKAECWGTLALMIQLTPLTESIWRKSLLAFELATQVAEIRELQVRCPMRVVDLEKVEEWKVIPEYYQSVLHPLENSTAWLEITDDQAQTLFILGHELNLEFGISHLEIRPPVDALCRARFCTAAQHVDDDIFGLEDVHPALLKAFTKHPTLA